MHDAEKVTRGRAITNKLAKILGPAQVGNYVELAYMYRRCC